MGPRVDLAVCEKCRLDGIRSSDRPARSKSYTEQAFPAHRHCSVALSVSLAGELHFFGDTVQPLTVSPKQKKFLKINGTKKVCLGVTVIDAKRPKL